MRSQMRFARKDWKDTGPTCRMRTEVETPRRNGSSPRTIVVRGVPEASRAWIAAYRSNPARSAGRRATHAKSLDPLKRKSAARTASTSAQEKLPVARPRSPRLVSFSPGLTPPRRHSREGEFKMFGYAFICGQCTGSMQNPVSSTILVQRYPKGSARILPCLTSGPTFGRPRRRAVLRLIARPTSGRRVPGAGGAHFGFVHGELGSCNSLSRSGWRATRLTWNSLSGKCAALKACSLRAIETGICQPAGSHSPVAETGPADRVTSVPSVVRAFIEWYIHHWRRWFVR
jgi:hypothetical protein